MPRIPDKRPRRQRGWHRSCHYNRLSFDDVEKALAEAWEKENRNDARLANGPILQMLLIKGLNHMGPIPFGTMVTRVTRRDSMIAATAVQWLGTNVGFSWLEEVLKSAGYSVTLTDEGAQKQRAQWDQMHRNQKPFLRASHIQLLRKIGTKKVVRYYEANDYSELLHHGWMKTVRLNRNIDGYNAVLLFLTMKGRSVAWNGRPGDPI